MNEPLEIELKLELASPDQVRLNLADLVASGNGGTKSLISTYFDTPDQSLRKAGYSLRVREAGGRFVQTVKAEKDAAAGLYVRPEWEGDIPRITPVLDNAGPLMDVLGRETLDMVARAFVTEVERRVQKIECGGATILVADDCGEIRAGRHVEPIREVELELERGDPKAIFKLARRINEEMPVRLGVRSKSERGYNLLARKKQKAFKAEPVNLSPTDSTEAAFAKIAQSCIRQFRLNETLLLTTGTPAPLHQARVGLRRLRSAFSIFSPLFADDAEARRLRAELRWLAQTLGPVRDLDVLGASLSGPDQDAVAARRETAFAEAMEDVDSARTRLLMLDLAEWLAFGDWRQKAKKHKVLDAEIGEAARAILRKRRKKLKRNGHDLIDLPDEERHELRKEAKKLRYATEFFATIFADEPARSGHRLFSEKLQKLQDDLGELNDLAARPKLLSELGFSGDVQPATQNRDELLAKAHQDFLELVALDPFWR